MLENPCVMRWGLGFGFRDSGFGFRVVVRVSGFGFRVYGSGVGSPGSTRKGKDVLENPCVMCTGLGFRFRDPDFGFRVVVRVSLFRFRV